VKMRKFYHLFQPGNIGRMRLRNRIVMAPIGTNLADVNGAVTQRLIHWYAERAWGGAGLIIVENTLADVRFGRGLAQQLRIDHPKFTPGLNELAEAVQASGAKIAIQINIQGAGVDPELEPDMQPVGPSAISYMFDETSPGIASAPRLKKVKHLRALEKGEIEKLRASFTQAAGIAKAAGFDAIEIHGAHGYLLAGFMSPATNKREDTYGGDLDGRLKFVMEVYRGIREQVGDAFPILFRFSGREYMDGGRDIEESRLIAGKLEQLGVDALHISAGISMKAEPFTWTNPPTSFPQGAFIGDAHAIKKAVQIPVIGVGKIRDPDFAEKLLEAGRVDFIALGRSLIADPEWPIKAAEGRVREIRRCISCNRCMRIMSRKKIRCAVNARAGLEREFPMTPAAQSRRVAIVGGGPAGMEAARVAASRGHHVTLFEKERSLGGQLKLAVVPPFKNDLGGILAYLRHQIQILGVEVRLRHEIRPEHLKSKPFDVVVIAAGCEPPGEPSPPYTHAKVVRAWDVLSGKAKLSGKRVVVLGGGRVACETAEFLASKRRKEVTIIHPGPVEEMGRDLEPIFEWRLLMERLRECKVTILTGTSVTGITAEGVQVQGRASVLVPCDHVVLEEAPAANQSLMKELMRYAEKIVGIGDCVEPRDLYHAIHEGFRSAYRIA